MDCPASHILWTYWWEGEEDPPGSLISTHVAGCAGCLSLLQEWESLAVRLQKDLPAAPAHAGRGRRMLSMAAAAVLLLAVGGGFLVWRPDGAGDRVIPVQSGTYLLAGDGSGVVCRTGGSVSGDVAGGALVLSDATRIDLCPGARLSLEEPEAGERLRLRLHEGEARFSVARGAGVARVEMPTGVVRVLGTHFDVRLVPAAGGELPLAQVAVVTVTEGVVEGSTNAGDPMRAGAGERLFLLIGEPPLGQAIGAPSREMAERLADALESAPGSVPSGRNLALRVALLRSQNLYAGPVVAERVRDAARPVSERVRWVWILAALELPGSRGELDALRMGLVAGGSALPPEVAAALEAVSDG